MIVRIYSSWWHWDSKDVLARSARDGLDCEAPVLACVVLFMPFSVLVSWSISETGMISVTPPSDVIWSFAVVLLCITTEKDGEVSLTQSVVLMAIPWFLSRRDGDIVRPGVWFPVIPAMLDWPALPCVELRKRGFNAKSSICVVSVQGEWLMCPWWDHWSVYVFNVMGVVLLCGVGMPVLLLSK